MRYIKSGTCTRRLLHFYELVQMTASKVQEAQRHHKTQKHFRAQTLYSEHVARSSLNTACVATVTCLHWYRLSLLLLFVLINWLFIVFHHVVNKDFNCYKPFCVLGEREKEREREQEAMVTSSIYAAAHTRSSIQQSPNSRHCSSGTKVRCFCHSGGVVFGIQSLLKRSHDGFWATARDHQWRRTAALRVHFLASCQYSLSLSCPQVSSAAVTMRSGMNLHCVSKNALPY